MDAMKEFRQARRRELAWENSPDGILDATDIRSATRPRGELSAEVLIIQVLSRFPLRVRRQVQENATFFITYSDSYVMHGSKAWVILLNFSRRQSPAGRRRMIAHECGHLMDYLKDPTGNGGYAAEKRADDFAERYGFGRVFSERRLSRFPGAPQIRTEK